MTFKQLFEEVEGPIEIDTSKFFYKEYNNGFWEKYDYSNNTYINKNMKEKVNLNINIKIHSFKNYNSY